REPVDTLLEEQQLDAPVRCSLERLFPPRRGAAAATGLLLPAGERLGLLGESRLFEERQREFEELGRRRVSLARRRAQDATPRLGRNEVRERRAGLLRADDDDPTSETA